MFFLNIPNGINAFYVSMQGRILTSTGIPVIKITLNDYCLIFIMGSHTWIGSFYNRAGFRRLPCPVGVLKTGANVFLIVRNLLYNHNGYI